MTEENHKKEIHTITGVLGFTGKYIAKQLIEKGYTVQTLTNSPGRPNPYGDNLRIFPLDFNNEEALVNSLKGTDVLYVTYWVRFAYKSKDLVFFHSQGEENTRKLFDAAKKAGVGKIVYISISNPDENSPYEYFYRKARIEKYLMSSGLPYAILRPCVPFGNEDILFNNIAWAIRKFPLFPVFKEKECKIQPIFVEDMAALAIECAQKKENILMDACGPEIFQYRVLAKTICKILNKKRWILTLPSSWIYFAGKIISMITGDQILTRDEMNALNDGYMYSRNTPVAPTCFTQWLEENKKTFGIRYANETKRRRDRKMAY
ncbi:MAG: NAD(P)H-binding protein [Bacteroidota bacterium]